MFAQACLRVCVAQLDVAKIDLVTILLYWYSNLQTDCSDQVIICCCAMDVEKLNKAGIGRGVVRRVEHIHCATHNGS